jgi:hypothetical protein
MEEGRDQFLYDHPHFSLGLVQYGNDGLVRKGGISLEAEENRGLKCCLILKGGRGTSGNGGETYIEVSDPDGDPFWPLGRPIKSGEVLPALRSGSKFGGEDRQNEQSVFVAYVQA